MQNDKTSTSDQYKWSLSYLLTMTDPSLAAEELASSLEHVMEDFLQNGHIAVIMIIGKKKQKKQKTPHCVLVKAMIFSSQVVPVKCDPVSLWNIQCTVCFGL